jgi:hypothetical protein
MLTCASLEASTDCRRVSEVRQGISKMEKSKGRVFLRIAKVLRGIQSPYYVPSALILVGTINLFQMNKCGGH